MSDAELGDSTAAVWLGEEQAFAHGAITPPIFSSVTFGYDRVDEWGAVARGESPGHIYSRNTNPTVAVLEDKIRGLEGGEAATSFATGMAAISNTLRALLSPGQRVVSVRDSYGGTLVLFREFLPALGIEVELCATEDAEAIEREVAKGCALLYLETPTNPALSILDVNRLAAAGHAVGATVVVDNTFATPINQRPLKLGADLVLHSATKFLNGHSDAMGGLLVGSAELVAKVFHYREIHGGSLPATSAALIARGMKTLALRIARHNENAGKLAALLDAHEAVEYVRYPGLPSHPGHAVAKAQMSGFGGMLSFSLRGGAESAARVIESLRFAHRAASLGSVGTLVGTPATTSHVEVSPEERRAAGIPEGLVRVSAGIEDWVDLRADFEAALSNA